MAKYKNANGKLFSGRSTEITIINKLLTSPNSELLAVTGRRRVGKTYLIKHAFEKHLCFHYTGRRDVSKDEQLDTFTKKVLSYKIIRKVKAPPTSWTDGFELLKQLILKTRSTKKKAIFLDEMPWMATQRSGFLSAFEYFWNDWAVDQNIVVVICGSAASWMIKNIVHNKGGLHNRITRYIKLQPFTLAETESYFKARSIRLPHYEILQIYMAIGGVPYYLKEINPGESAIQNIDRICFSNRATLKDEFDKLYSSLFTNYEAHLKIIKALAKKRKGLTRNQISKAISATSGGGLTRTLRELEESSFIASYPAFGKSQRDMLYRLTDEYSIFYLQFISKQKMAGKNVWLTLSQSSKYKAWAGFAFEGVVIKHAPRIKKALNIEGIYTEQSTYSANGTKHKEGFQIDLLIDRNDNAINICEIKFYNNDLNLSKKDIEKLRNRRELFRQDTKTKKLLQNTIITTYGFKHNQYSIGTIDQVILMDKLFD